MAVASVSRSNVGRLLSFCPLQLEFGVIHHCTEERLYTGRRGQGAFCNGQRLQVSRETGGVHSALLGLFQLEIDAQGGVYHT